MKNIFMFDVESIGLHGDGFAFGAIISDRKENVIEICSGACLNEEVTEKLSKIDFFVNGEGKDIISECSKLKRFDTLWQLREYFWEFYMKHKDNCDVYSDVNYPVETNFLESVYNDNPEDRQWKMPFPLLDACNSIPQDVDRIEEYTKDNSSYIVQDVATRKPVKHNPVWDCVSSLHCLIKYGKGKI